MGEEPREKTEVRFKADSIQVRALRAGTSERLSEQSFVEVGKTVSLVVSVYGTPQDSAKGVPVQFSVKAGDGSISQPYVTTSSGGYASVSFTLGTNVQENTVEVQVEGLSPHLVNIRGFFPSLSLTQRRG